MPVLKIIALIICVFVVALIMGILLSGFCGGWTSNHYR